MESLFAQNVLEVLAILFLEQEDMMHQSKIIQLTGLHRMQVQRALQRLKADKVIEEYRQGNMTFYTLNKNHPLFQDIKNIIYKTILIAEPFRTVLSSFSEKINMAFIYGSYASGTAASESDIDLLIIGKLGLKEISKLLMPIAKKLQKEINPVVYTKEEFEKKLLLKDHFLLSVLDSEKLWLIGDENDLRKIDEGK
jgi:predicted nucleotidyltransferase